MRVPVPSRRRLLAVPLLVAVAALGVPAGAPGQTGGLSIEVRGGATWPVRGFASGGRGAGAGELGTAPSLGVHFAYRGPGAGGAYFGFSQHRFDCTERECPGDEYVATDWDVGALWGFGRGRVVPWLRLGVVMGRVERDVPGASGPVRRQSDLSAGAAGAVGLAVRVGGRASLSPAVRYTWMNTRFSGGELLRMRYWLADLGLSLHF